jgi:hypothetical protein
MFQNDDVFVVKLAIKSLINSLEFPPTVADVRKEINKLIKTTNNEPEAIDEWNAIRHAIKSSIYYSAENFENLPPIAQKFVGSPSQLKAWAMEEDFQDGVLRGQFLKQYEVLKEREHYNAMLPENVKAKIYELAEKKSTQFLLGGET